jgi:UDP-N-acetylmuramyl tripeptide synthase
MSRRPVHAVSERRLPSAAAINVRERYAHGIDGGRMTTAADGVLQIISPLIGRPNVYNVLAAVAVGISLNVNLKVLNFTLSST